MSQSSYNKHINGFAALLEEEEAADIASKRIYKTSTLLFSVLYSTNEHYIIKNESLYQLWFNLFWKEIQE